MAKQVEFFFDIVSPASYLAWTQMPGLVEETGAEVIHRPFFLPGVFMDAGSSSPITVPAKGKWLFRDLERFAERYCVPFVMNDNFPISSLYLMRGLIAFREAPEFKPLGDGFYQAMWVNNQDLTDPAVIQKVVEQAGIEADHYMTAIGDPAIKQAVFDITEEAVSRGVFGAPTFFVGDEMYWGQDRLDFVREALLA